ncbi:unnamed protein product [Microthlaspi erraticum]|uniref:Integrase catalytic domain-containing protein n=1 Tax=Microthlaspi erraticum TaxID=1685480 RepID=A0A6D2KUL4_9BRAS|nr:unnamed protein product [Microthlaspi erraticum]CAA7056078.1 unnamed protein product [Microthlaspi erraticum]
MSHEDRQRLLCSSCGRNGHVAENCFRTPGYPDWWGDRPRNKNTLGRGGGNSTSRGTSACRAPSTNQAPPARANAVTTSDRLGFSGLNDEQWKSLVEFLDQRATNHMTGSLDYLTDPHDMAPMSVKLPDGRFTVASKQGSVRLGSHLTLQNVLFVDGLHCHLISVSQLTRERTCVLQITDELCIIQDRMSKNLIGAAEQARGLYFFREIEAVAAAYQMEFASYDIWHKRLGHPSSKVMDLLSFSSSGFDKHSFLSKTCETCLSAKQTRDVFSTSINKTNDLFQLVHVDLWGPYRTTALCRARYFLTILDDYSHGLWLYLLPSKHDVSKTIKNFIALVERQFDKTVKTVRSDNGSEFVCLSEYFREHGIIHETSCVHTPQQNGRVERKHRHILNIARALRFQSHLPIEFWGECVLTAAYLINRTPTPLLQGKKPFELIHNKTSYSSSFTTLQSGYWRDIFFQKCCADFPYPIPTRTEKVPLFSPNLAEDFIGNHPLLEWPDLPDSTDAPVSLDTSLVLPTSPSSAVPSPAEEQPAVSDPHDSPQTSVLPDSVLEETKITTDREGDAITEREGDVSSPAPEVLGRGRRTRHLPTKLHDYVLQTTASPPLTFDEASFAITNYIDCGQFSEAHRVYLGCYNSRY